MFKVRKAVKKAWQNLKPGPPNWKYGSLTAVPQPMPIKKRIIIIQNGLIGFYTLIVVGSSKCLNYSTFLFRLVSTLEFILFLKNSNRWKENFATFFSPPSLV